MKVLLSAYGCEPAKGSEPGIGWHWALEIARLGHEVHVLTRANNRLPIEVEEASGALPPGLTFHYYDLPPWLRSWKRGTRGMYLYYLLWQVGGASLARRLHASIGFEFVHHITFGGFRLPSLMGSLGVPLLLGPIGGGEATPLRLRRGYRVSAWLYDALRDLSNMIVSVDPLTRRSFAAADTILVKTAQTRDRLPSRFRAKCRVLCEIGTEPDEIRLTPPAGDTTTLRLIYVGRFIYWKGMHVGLRALADAVKRGVAVHLTMVGDGPEAKRWTNLTRQLGIESNVTWHRWLSRAELAALWPQHDALLFPSLRDSSGNVIFEAATSGLPTLCLDLAGPGTIVDERNGIKIPVDGLTDSEAARRLGAAMANLAADPAGLTALQRSALAWAGEQSWSTVVGRVYKRVVTLATEEERRW